MIIIYDIIDYSLICNSLLEYIFWIDMKNFYIKYIEYLDMSYKNMMIGSKMISIILRYLK